MTVYNTDLEILKIAIDSLLNQTYKNFEFIIIDDCSTNNPSDLIKKYNDSRIIYVQQKQKSRNYIELANLGLSVAKGKYISRLDSDDYRDVTCFEKQINFLENNPQVGLLGTFYQEFPNGVTSELPTNSKEIKLFIRYIGGVILHSSCMVRASVLKCNNITYIF